MYKRQLLQCYLEYLGVEPGRIQFSWVSASEGNRFAEVVTKVTNDIKKLGPARRLNINAGQPVAEEGAR